MDYIIYFAITIGILVFIHEFGHFAAAKLSGMRADVFAIGFGKRLFGWNRKSGFSFGELPKDFDGEGHTDYRLSLLPLGGYVKIAGMVDESGDVSFADKEPQPYEFRAKPVWAKIFVITAGVFMNLMLAWVIFWGANFFQEKTIIDTTTIDVVPQNSLADSVGFKSYDKIISINNKQVNNWRELEAELYINSIGENRKILVERNNQKVELAISKLKIPEQAERYLIEPNGMSLPFIDSLLAGEPASKAGLLKGDILIALNESKIYSSLQAQEILKSNKNKNINTLVIRNSDSLKILITPNKAGLIGVYFSSKYDGPTKTISYGFFESVYYGWKDIEKITALTFSMMGKVFSGNIEVGKAFGGPIKIAKFAAKSADSGISSFLYFLALLSLSLAILNIMPFPVLDGGHLVMIIIEAIIKREIPIKIKMAIQNTGLVLLLLLMAFIIYNDIISL
jgi:regulator of sigma E protease